MHAWDNRDVRRLAGEIRKEGWKEIGYRIIKRRFMYHKKSRPDMSEGCAEKIDWTFVNYVWNFKKKNRPQIIALLDAYSDQKNMVILRSRRMVAEYIEQMKKSVKSRT